MQNMLQQAPPQMQQGMPQQAPPQPSPQQVQDFHEHSAYMQQMLDSLIKLPDSELNLQAIFDAAADSVHQNQLSGGKKGISAAEIAAEMSAPNFPDAKTPPQQIRQFLQQYFDKSVMAQAMISHKFGAPQQSNPQS